MKKRNYILAALCALPMMLLSSYEKEVPEASLELIGLTTSNVGNYFDARYEYDQEKTLEVDSHFIYINIFADLKEDYTLLSDCSLVFNLRVVRYRGETPMGYSRREELRLNKGEVFATKELDFDTYGVSLPSDTVVVEFSYLQTIGKVAKK